MLDFIIKKTEKTIRSWISLPTKKKLSNMVFLWEVRIQRKEGSRKHLGFFLQLSEMVMSMNFSISSIFPLQNTTLCDRRKKEIIDRGYKENWRSWVILCQGYRPSVSNLGILDWRRRTRKSHRVFVNKWYISNSVEEWDEKVTLDREDR